MELFWVICNLVTQCPQFKSGRLRMALKISLLLPDSVGLEDIVVKLIQIHAQHRIGHMVTSPPLSIFSRICFSIHIDR